MLSLFAASAPLAADAYTGKCVYRDETGTSVSFHGETAIFRTANYYNGYDCSSSDEVNCTKEMSDEEQYIISLSPDRNLLLFGRANLSRPERSSIEVHPVDCE